MKHLRKTHNLKRSALTASLALSVCLGIATPLLAAQPLSNNNAAQKCLSDLRVFHSQMQKDGYWRQGPGYVGYGYPMFGYGNDAPAKLPSKGTIASYGYLRASSGYEVRTLMATANILAHRGQQQECEALLSATRDIYKAYTADLRNGGLAMADVPGWRNQQIVSAKPATGSSTSYSTDQLVGTDVVDPQGVNLGSVDDVVMDPQSGKIDYLMIGRGGIFGIDEKFIPVPWEDFKVSNGAYLLVLNATKSSMDAAPQTHKNQFARNDESKKVDDYWKNHLSQ